MPTEFGVPTLTNITVLRWAKLHMWNLDNQQGGLPEPLWALILLGGH